MSRVALVICVVLLAASAAACDGPACLPRPVGRDCMGYGSPMSGTCPSYTCLGAERDGGHGLCAIGAACTTAEDCPCSDQVCTHGVCWY